MEIEKLEKLMNIIKNSQHLVFFGGAGVSTASNIPDFRGANGLYNYTPEDIISHTFFKEHTKEFYEFYFDKMVYLDALPNECHKFLALLEENKMIDAVITQNIDGLHQKAGSRNVLELHGSIHRNYCQVCKREYGLDYILRSDGLPRCECGGIIKPDVVLYEEPLNNEVLSESIDYISNADTLIIGGTSLVVYPAAGLINYFNGSKLVLINKSETPYDSLASLVINEAIGETLSQIEID